MKLREIFGRKNKVESFQKENALSEEEISDLWTQCKNCKSMIYNTELKKNQDVCPNCNYHLRTEAYSRIEHLIDPGSWQELNSCVQTDDLLDFVDLKKYKDRLEGAKKKSGSTEAVVTGLGQINQKKVALSVMDFSFLGGSMGSVVGERFYRLAERAVKERVPLVSISSSGGARMHEGLTSLMQMAKTSLAVKLLSDQRLLYLSVLTDPTYGGVSASFASLGDIIIAEPNAKIGFAGPRVIEGTIRQKLPKSFQTSEYLLEHGQVDLIVERKKLKSVISELICLHH